MKPWIAAYVVSNVIFVVLSSVDSENCPEGYYCPSNSEVPLGCGDLLYYCPAGSTKRTRVRRGYYAVTSFDQKRKNAYEERSCPRGYYCPIAEDGYSTGEKVPCPAGFYGHDEMETSPTCSGLCEAGYYCLNASTSPHQNKCGNATVYCPKGSIEPLRVPSGAYSIHGSSQQTRVSFETCPEGFWCAEGVSRPCGAGRYGSTRGLTTSACSGLCKEGYFCNTMSTTPTQHPCGTNASIYCPRGSKEPMTVSEGYYTLGGHDAENQGRTMERLCPRGEYCVAGERYACPSGSYGATLGLSNSSCSGACEAGFYCPVRSYSSRQLECGNASVYCESGSSEPRIVPVGFYSTSMDGTTSGKLSIRTSVRECEEGHYCQQGLRFECMAGRWGGETGLSDPKCSGPCEQGYWCPRASVRAKQIPCGGTDVYCPIGSASPLRVSRGFYTSTHDDREMEIRSSAVTCLTDTFSNCTMYPNRVPYLETETHLGFETTRSRQIPCDAGHFCSADGRRYECPPGRYESDDESSDPMCSGTCEAGFFCPPASISPRENVCGDVGTYCEGGNGAPTPVSVGYYTLKEETHGVGYASQVPCEPGTYCHGGIASNCRAGYYGSEHGLSESTCTGACWAGYYCPIGSDNPIACADSDLARDLGNAESVYCPMGSSEPVAVSINFYTMQGVHDGTTNGNNATRSAQRPCDAGTFCVGGVSYLCPSGTYGSSGLVFSDDESMSRLIALQQSIRLSESCPGLGDGSDACGVDASDSTMQLVDGSVTFASMAYEVCEGLCSAGYFCDSGSTTPTQHECGGVDVFCPEGSGQPRRAKKGYYTVGGNETTRTHEVICPKGSYCWRGEKYACPAGTYGNEEGLSGPINGGYNTNGDGNFRCTGFCPAGSRCAEGTVDPFSANNTCPIGTFSYAGASECTECPVRFAERETDEEACTTSRKCCHW